MSLPTGDRELLQIMDASLRDASERAGEWLACRPGCTQCCHGAFSINVLDALRLSAGMETLHAIDPALAIALEQRAHAWIAEHGKDFPGDTTSGILGTSDADRERFEDFANEAACPALNPETGCCDLYNWRPMTCRVFGPPIRVADNAGLGCCELCFVNASTEEIARCEMRVPHELETALLCQVADSRETLVAFALLRSAFFR